MSKEEMTKYAYELMIKNNPDEVIKNLILLEQLQQRIDKAIEYIKDNACYINDGKNKEMCVDDINYDECMELLNILRGESDEER